MSWLYSLALVEEYSAGLSSDGVQSVPSRSSPIPRAYLSNDRMTVFSRLSRFGMTFAPLTESHGAGLLTLYLAGFPAKISAPPEREQASRASAPASGKNTPGLLAKYDRDSSSWKTVLSSLFEDLEPSSVIFPRWGMTRDGALFQRPTPALRTCGKESGLLPTPATVDSGSFFNRSASSGAALRPTLGAMAKHNLWPTPTVQDANGRDRHNQRDGSTIPSLLGRARMWPTPTKSSGTGAGGHGTGGLNLQTAVKLWPTPGAEDSHHGGRGGSPERIAKRMAEGRQIGLQEAVRADPAQPSGSLNPTWVEWLMGWPQNWTSLDPLDKEEYDYWYESQFGKKGGSTEDSSLKMRNVWWDKDPSEASQGWEPDEQFIGKHNYSVPEMPYQNTFIERDMGERSDKPSAMQNMRRDIPTNQKPSREVVRETRMSPGEWPHISRVAVGVKARVDRLKAIGNGQVPAVVRLAWEILAEEGSN